MCVTKTRAIERQRMIIQHTYQLPKFITSFVFHNEHESLIIGASLDPAVRRLAKVKRSNHSNGRLIL